MRKGEDERGEKDREGKGRRGKERGGEGRRGEERGGEGLIKERSRMIIAGLVIVLMIGLFRAMSTLVGRKLNV